MSAEPVPINVVTAEDLIRLRGIGPVYAARIIAYRDEHGPFRTPADLAQVQGISLELAEQLAPDIDWRTAEEMQQTTLIRWKWLVGQGLQRTLRQVLGGDIDNAAWNGLKEAVGERDTLSDARELLQSVSWPKPMLTPLAQRAPLAVPEIINDEGVAASLELLKSTEVPSVHRFSAREPQLMLVPAGPFWMGSDSRKDISALSEEEPLFVCRLVRCPYYIGRYPITVAEYQDFIDAGGYHTRSFWTGAGWEWRARWNITSPSIPSNPVFQQSNHPQVGVSWYEAVAYCRWFTRTTGRLYRLPTEAEWEKAARGTDGRLYPWGNGDPTSVLCNFNMNIGHTTPVGRYSPQGDSSYGCADMAGNVWEWCSTKWRSSYVDYQGLVDDDLKGDFPRVERGGSYYQSQGLQRCALRFWSSPYYPSEYLGFRVVHSSSTLELRSSGL